MNALGSLRCRQPPALLRIGDCDYDEGALYDPESSTWGRSEGRLWKVGVTPLLSWLSGGFTSASSKPVGTKVDQGNSLGSIEGPRHFDVVRAPFDCVVKEANQRLAVDPRAINRDPFGEGWFAVVEKIGRTSRLVSLRVAAPVIEQRLKSMRVRCFPEFPDAEMYEIGTECSAVLVRLNELLARSARGTVVHLVTDDPTADVEMERWKDQTGNAVLDKRAEGALYHFIVKKV